MFSLFSELLQVALGRRDALSRVPTGEEWRWLQEEAKRQAVVGILFSGIERLPLEQRPDEDLFYGWWVDVNRLEERNAKMDKRCLALLRKMEEGGLRATILKGQGVAKLYGPLRARRQCGDIDLFVDGGFERVMHRVPKDKLGEWGYKHVDLRVWRDTEVELHYRVEYISDPVRNRRLQQWFAAHNEELFHRDGEWVTPTLEMNLFYILLHIYRHFIWQGVGLRQIIDYYFCLKRHNENCAIKPPPPHGDSPFCKGENFRTQDPAQSRAQGAMPSAGRLSPLDKGEYPKGEGVHNSQFSLFNSPFTIPSGLNRFARGLMWVMGEVLAMPREWMPWPPDEKEGRFILEQVQAGGNFGTHQYHSSHSMNRTLRHSLHLFRHYPAEVFATPLWAIYNRLWKLRHSRQS